MKTETLTISDDRFLAEFIRQEEFRAFFEKRFEVPPDHMGLLMRNGQFVEAFKGAHLTVGGLMHQLKGLIGGSQSISLLLADLKTFQGLYDFNAITKDKVDINGVVALELQINPERPQNILGLMSGRKSLAKADVISRIKPHLWDRVFEAAVSRVNADEVRGNKGLQDMIQADLMKEVERIAGDLGLLVRSVSVDWAVNAVEKGQMQKAAAERETARLEFEFETLKGDLEREQQTTEIRMTNKTDLDKLELNNAADLERLVLDREIEFVDARETGKRVAEMKVLEHEINLLRTERMERFQAALQRATHEGVDMRVINERGRSIERSTAELDTEHRLKLRALERDYDAESRGLQRDELQQNRREDRDYDWETRQKELDTRKKERDYNFDTRKGEVDVGNKEEYARLDRLREQNKVTRENLKGMQDLENDVEKERLDRRIKEADSTHRRTMDERRLEAQREVDRLQLGSKLSPEQILAINAGLSPAVAKVLEEQAKAQATGNQAQMNLMREMVDQATRAKVATDEQARAMFQMGMQGAAGVAAGAGGKVVVDGGLDGGTTVECPKCTRVNSSKAKFCVGCGEQLRR